MTDTDTAEDITNLKAELHEAKVRVEAINSAMATIEFEPDGTILYANEAFLGAVGYSLNEVVGQHHSIFLFEKDRNTPEYRDHWPSLARGESKIGRFLRMTKTGDELWIDASYLSLTDVDGRVYKVVKYARAVTHHVNAMTALRKGLARLAEGDLRSPITEELGEGYEDVRVDFNQAQAKLGQAMHDVLHAAIEIESSSEKLAESAKHLAKRTEHQASSLEETSSSIRSMTKLVENTSENADNAKDSVQKTKDQAASGSEIMGHARECNGSDCVKFF